MDLVMMGFAGIGIGTIIGALVVACINHAPTLIRRVFRGKSIGAAHE